MQQPSGVHCRVSVDRRYYPLWYETRHAMRNAERKDKHTRPGGSRNGEVLLQIRRRWKKKEAAEEGREGDHDGKVLAFGFGGRLFIAL